MICPHTHRRRLAPARLTRLAWRLLAAALFVVFFTGVLPAQLVLNPAVEDIHVLRSYRAGKNSFVEASDRAAGRWTGKGFRYTLLDVQGIGSLRHIWSTWRADGPYLEWEIYVDGESEPSLRGPLPELVAAAERVKESPAPASSVPHATEFRDFNFFLPVPFEKSLRLDVVQQTPRVGLFFAQLDYRTEDESLRGVRLRSRRADGELSLYYEGWRPNPRPAIRTSPVQFPRKEIGPGERVLLGSLDGPALVRRFTLNAPLDATLRLQVRYDGAAGYAIDVPISRYFGQFDGASFARLAADRGASYLPMPFRSNCRFYLENGGTAAVQASLEVDVEKVPRFEPDWGYLHAFYHRSERTNGHRPHQVLYVCGRGHWLGMSLFNTGHDHGGGDFAVIDGESPNPAFLHGVNGEDYFTFAWFGRGQHRPYAQALSNEEGRYRHHFENPYPFRHSFHVEWGAMKDLQPESVAVWYQDTPEDTTVALDDPLLLEEWQVFGPVPIPLTVSAQKGDLFAVLPSLADLDRGQQFKIQNAGESFVGGWLWEDAAGPSLNLTYISRHGVPVAGERNLGGNGHAFVVRKRFLARKAEVLELWLSHDDPIEVELNGEVVYREKQGFAGFGTRKVTLPVRAGDNELIVRLSNYFNQTFNWTGFSAWFTDSAGQARRLSDLHR